MTANEFKKIRDQGSDRVMETMLGVCQQQYSFRLMAKEEYDQMRVFRPKVQAIKVAKLDFVGKSKEMMNFLDLYASK